MSDLANTSMNIYVTKALAGWLPGTYSCAGSDFGDEVKASFPYMLEEVSDIYWNSDNKSYQQIYDEIIKVADKAVVLFQNDFPNNPEITTSYEKNKAYSRKYVPSTRDIDECDSEGEYNEARDSWKLKVRSFVASLIGEYSNVTRSQRMNTKRLSLQNACSIFAEKVGLTNAEVESVVIHLRDKSYIENEMILYSGFNKDTLLAMKAINKFAVENNISNQDTIELFCEYLNPLIANI